ncbi:zinc finger protein 518B [Eptesicus fuscus]|uniref:zinc finger protein 518B n=1 Tax=Eptesicus fuscus TaxID=29078 RepID=UPI0024044E0F|nr:zinc finger protein 518B [Eptesicus fuscus]
MKDVGQQLFSSQVLDGHNSLTMSPRQPHANRATRPDRQEAQAALYQGSEAEAAVMTTATCVKCKAVHQIPLQDLKKGPGQSHKEDRYVCFQCSLGVASPHFPFGNSDPSATRVGNKADTIASPGNNKFKVARQLRLIAVKPDQLIKCPRRNQPVIVLNHPDVDSPEVTNVMKVINKYKGNVLKVVLSERTRCQLGIRRHHVRLTYQNVEEANQIKRQMMLKMKLKKVHKNNYQVVDSLPDDSPCTFKCWFCGRLYEDQEEWMSHGQRHLIEATRDWDVLSSKGK